MDCSDKCELILKWAKGTGAKFDTSIVDWGIEHEFTDSQESAIDNIYEKWKVDLWAKKTGRL